MAETRLRTENKCTRFRDYKGWLILQIGPSPCARVDYTKHDLVLHHVSMGRQDKYQSAGVSQSAVWLAIVKLFVCGQRATQSELCLRTVTRLRKIDNVKCLIPRFQAPCKFCHLLEKYALKLGLRNQFDVQLFPVFIFLRVL